jgi:multiple sugar transport system ATP-binding protein
MAQVVIRNLSKKFDGLHVVKDVNVEIHDEEFVVLVGPSGCGKTTTLRMVAGLESITSGEILIGGKVVNELPPMDRDIAMVFQNYALYPHMSVYDNMAFGLKMRKFDRTEIGQRVLAAAEILGIQDYLERKPRQLSGGGSASPWAAPSCGIRRYSCSTNRCRTWTPSCVSRCASSSRRSTSGSAPRPST